MTNKEFKRQRMMGYFIDAAIEILDNEGLEAVSARKVAEKAGYSYATIYNYFEDINHLLWHCAPVYVSRLNQQLQPEALPGPSGRDRLRQAIRLYARFFVRHPHGFRFMFLSNLGPPPAELAQWLKQATFNDTLVRLLNQCFAEGSLIPSSVPALVSLIGFTINGALMFYVSGRMDVSEGEFIAQLDQALDVLLKGGEGP